MVMSVDGNGPGARAGVQQGDIISTWDGKAITSVNAMLRSLGPSSVGTSVSLSLRRDADARAVDLKVGESPEP